MLLARAPFLRWGRADKCLVGLNCMQPFGYGNSSGGSYVYSGSDPYTYFGENDATILPDARLAKIKTTGFDFVRMAIDPGTLLAAPNDATLDTLNAAIVTAIGRRVAAGLKVSVDMHVLGSHPVAGWTPYDLVDGPSGPKMSRLKYVVARLAAAMWAVQATTCPASEVCLEIFNEPGGESLYSPPYNTQIRDYWNAVRAVCDFTLVVGGSTYNSIDGTPAGDNASGLTHMVASDFDGNTAFGFHPYESGVFTHQGVDNTIYHCASDLTFPASAHPGGQAKAEADFTAAANAHGHTANIAPVVTNTTWSSSINKYFTQYGSKAMLATRLAVATTWAGAAGVDRRRLFNTEFGVNFHGAGNATDASAAAFILATREISQEAGIGCVCIHEMQYTSSDFGIQDSTTPWDFNAAIVAALFGA